MTLEQWQYWLQTKSLRQHKQDCQQPQTHRQRHQHNRQQHR